MTVAPALSPPCRLGELELAPLSVEATEEWLAVAAAARTPCVIVTSNINHLRLADRDPRFRDVVRRSDLNVADGWPLVLASRLLGTPVPERVAGIDLVARLLNRGGFRLAVLGGPPGAAETLAHRFASRNEVVLIDGLVPGTWEGRDAMRALAERVAAARANLVLVGIGPPRQELLADALRAAAAGPIICCGASIEVLAGLRPRAPRWMQSVGLEWAFRFALEPRRLGPRYALAGARFLRVVARDLVTRSRVRR
jgi:N-acetylglucosaminyldiphosphoundecaprenol N-acetyl-beta-D-mannosaminyltransferase